MDAKVKSEILNHINETIKDFKKEVDMRINGLKNIKKYNIDDELRDEIDNIISKLEDAKKITMRDLGYGSRGPTKAFINDRSRMDFLLNREKKNDDKIADKKTKLSSKRGSTYLKNRIHDLKQKKGRIQKKQVKVADRIVVAKLQEYKKSHEINLDKVDRVIGKTDSIIHAAAKITDKKEEIYELKKEDRKIKATNKNAISRHEENRKNIDRLESQLEKLKNKNTTKGVRISHQLIRTANPRVITRLKNGAKKVGKTLANKYYDMINAVEQAFSK